MAEKGSKYLSQLDEARCNGKWDEVPELARKVEKHVSSRKCLVATARAEAKVATYPVRKADPGAKATNSQSEKPGDELLVLIRELEAAIQFDKHNVEDRFQAQTCLAWLYWNNSDYRNAKNAVPQNIPSASEGKKLGDWTIVCIIKAAFFRASSEEGLANIKDVPSAYEACLNTIQSLPAPTLGLVEFCFWWERFFSRCCGCFYGVFLEKFKAKRRSIDTRACLQAFRAWLSNWDHLAGTLNSSSESAKQKRNQRLLIWKSYYHVLSATLQYGYPYSLPTNTKSLENGNLNATGGHGKSLLLELEKVEALYESILLRQMSFPKASERNTEVEEWTNAVMTNWNITCGPDWQEEDSGPGGKAVATRRVLESMYRAATLTFHSSTILRHLFTLHAALAEFALAEKALDTYLEIVTKGKARVQKSGVPEPDLDSDELMLQTIVNGIEMLCEFGRRSQILKSTDLANRLVIWAEQHGQDLQTDQKSSSPQTGEIHISKHVHASVYRAIAISKASWAKLSYEPKERAKLQTDAIKYLKLALQSDHSVENDPSFLYPLALVLAETRNIEGAVAAIKQALSGESKPTESADRKSLTQASRDKSRINRSMIESWHLLSLLLSSRQEFGTATIATQTVLEQFDGKERSSKPSLEDRKLSFFLKKQIIELKITQVSLAEISEGPQDAINLTAELLSLYARLFEAPTPPKTARTEVAPMTATGTVKSFRGSVFGRYRKSVRNSMVSLPRLDKAHQEPLPPTIAVTSDDMNSPRPSSQLPVRNPSHKLQKNRSRQSIRKSRSVSPSRAETRASMASESVTSELRPSTANQLRPASAWSNDPSEVGLAVSHDYPTVRTAQAVSMQHGQALRLSPNTESRSVKSPETVDLTLDLLGDQDSSFRTPLPILPSREEQRYAIALLNQIWLFVSALYRRSNNFDDAKEAMDEAFKQAKLVEASKAQPGPSSVKSFDEAGWGGMKSVEEIWADSYAEMGHLCVAQGDPYEAMVKYEGALSHYPDHAEATVSLAHILLDIHAKKIPLSRKQPTLIDQTKVESQDNDETTLPVFSKAEHHIAKSTQTNGLSSATHHHKDIRNDAVENADQDASHDLDLLAARDRAYTMLYNLTKLGSGWDDSDAWFALGNAYEASGQIEKAKEVLWWVVELEEKRPVRHWSCLGQGYKLRR